MDEEVRARRNESTLFHNTDDGVGSDACSAGEPYRDATPAPRQPGTVRPVIGLGDA